MYAAFDAYAERSRVLGQFQRLGRGLDGFGGDTAVVETGSPKRFTFHQRYAHAGAGSRKRRRVAARTAADDCQGLGFGSHG